MHNAKHVLLKEHSHQRRKGRKVNQDLGPVGDVLGINAGRTISCEYCGFSEGVLKKKFLKCSGCETTLYCSEKCQLEGWDYHEPFCTSTQDQKRENISSKKRQKLAMNEFEAAFSELKMSEKVGTNAVPNESSNSKQSIPKNVGKNKKKNKKKKTNHF